MGSLHSPIEIILLGTILTSGFVFLLKVGVILNLDVDFLSLGDQLGEDVQAFLVLLLIPIFLDLFDFLIIGDGDEFDDILSGLLIEEISQGIDGGLTLSISGDGGGTVNKNSGK